MALTGTNARTPPRPPPPHISLLRWQVVLLVAPTTPLITEVAGGAVGPPPHISLLRWQVVLLVPDTRDLITEVAGGAVGPRHAWQAAPLTRVASGHPHPDTGPPPTHHVGVADAAGHGRLQDRALLPLALHHLQLLVQRPLAHQGARAQAGRDLSPSASQAPVLPRCTPGLRARGGLWEQQWGAAEEACMGAAGAAAGTRELRERRRLCPQAWVGGKGGRADGGPVRAGLAPHTPTPHVAHALGGGKGEERPAHLCVQSRSARGQQLARGADGSAPMHPGSRGASPGGSAAQVPALARWGRWMG